MITFPPIQPRPILCKTTTNNLQSTSSPMYLVQSSTILNSDLKPIDSSSQIPSTISASLTPSEEFLKRLHDFHRGRQTTFRCLPTIAGQVVDLHLLYNTVVSHGGWEKVNDRHLWPTIALHFSIDSTCLNGTQALKNLYIRYLYAFEKISHGENIDAHDDENEDSKRRTVSQLQRVPQSYNHAQHNVSETMRSQHGLFNDFIRRNEYEKLELALLSGFPNELTFTLNTLLLLSSSSSHSKSFHLYKCPRLLDLLLRHIGLFSSSDGITGDHSLKMLYENIWSKHLNYHLDRFWIESCSSEILQSILNLHLENDSNNFDEYLNLNSNETSQEQEFRIEQILMIIRNLSFDRLNALYLLESLQSSSSITYQFLLLISYSVKKIEFGKYASDIWTNLAMYMHLRLIADNEGLLFRQLLNHMLNHSDREQQEDRLTIIRTLEIISNLAHAGNDNGIYLIDYIQIIVEHFLHIPDILVLIHALECLYQLSELGEQLCDAILNVQSSTSVISTLIDLLTIEARSFSSQTIKTIKIVEMSTGPVLLPSYHQPPVAPQSLMIIPANQPIPQAQSYVRPLTITAVNPVTNVLSVATSSSFSPMLPNANEKKRKHDSISETIAAVVNGSSSPAKRLRPIPSKKPSLLSSTSLEDDNTVESHSLQSTMADLLDRCSFSPVDDDLRSCLNDLCQRVVFLVDQSQTDIYNQLPSPVFQRKMETQITPKDIDQNEEQLPKKNPNRLMRKKSLTEYKSSSTDVGDKKDETIEQELTDVKPIASASLTTNTLDYMCEWDNCRVSFATPRAVFHHVYSVHVKHLADYVCLWNGCDRLRRQKWALISHVQERHCSEVAFRQAKLKLTNPGSSISTNTVPIPTNVPIPNNRPGTVGYAPDAAWLAIRRHMQIGSFDDQIMKSKEGPLTKSIRLTAALILRNIARHSSSGKQNLRQYEPLIANLALESFEASQTLSSCLFELYN